MHSHPDAKEQFLAVHDLTLRLEEAEATLRAIRIGEVDALVIKSGHREQICTLNTADRSYRRLFDSLNEGALLLAGDGAILYANRKFAELASAAPDRLPGTPFASHLVPEERTAFAGLLARAAEENGKGESTLLRPDGTRVPVMVSINPVDVEGLGRACTLVVTDLRELKQAQEALEQANAELEARVRTRTEALEEADRKKDEFLSMLAHELRSPLAPIMYAAELLRQCPDDGILRRQREIIHRQVHHLGRLVDDLMDLSRISRGTVTLQREMVDLIQVTRRAVETVRPLIDQAGHALSLQLPGSPVVLAADPVRLEQMLVNLLTNATKYTERGGSIQLSVERTTDSVVIRLRDTGIGIEPDLLPRIFDLFVQADRSLDRARGGLGIGLTLVRRLAELHGGEIHAYSPGVPGLGSEFVLRLPCLASPAAREPERPDPAVRSAAPLCVLVVDDNRDTAEALGELLELWGHSVHLAHDGPGALEAAAKRAPAIVLCDLGLPGMDGFETARRLQEVPGLEPILIAVTGYGREEDRRRSRDAGFRFHLTKPVDPERLRALLQEFRPS